MRTQLKDFKAFPIKEEQFLPITQKQRTFVKN